MDFSCGTRMEPKVWWIFSSLAGRGAFALWLKPGLFEQVRLSDTGVPEWPGELDPCSGSLYMQLTGKSAEEIFPNLRRIS